MPSRRTSEPTLVLVGVDRSTFENLPPEWDVRSLPNAQAYLETAPCEFEVVLFPPRLSVEEQEWVAEEAHARGGVVLLVEGDDPQEMLARTLQLGADTFLCAPLDTALLTRIVRREADAVGRPQRDATPTSVRAFVGESPAIQSICAQLALVAPSDAPVLIKGESGTGKELVARAIHRLSPRRRGPLVTVNCGAIPPELVESELFGHERGAFTGADSRRTGCFELANGGTLFLDEIGDLETGHQVKLLRALEDHYIRRVGGSERVPVDVRIIAATHRDLTMAMHRASFREDLYYRLNVLNINVPALRERLVDVRVLWEHFVATAALEERSDVPETDDDALTHLEQHGWPGNVRELENVARRAVATRPSQRLTAACLPAAMRSRALSSDDEIRIPGMTLEELERAAILRTYHATGTVKRTAEILDVSERKIWYRLKEYRASSESHDPRPRLALVEDDADLRVAMRDLLLPSYVVQEYACAEDFLAEVEFDVPDIVVSDVRLPGLTGFEMLELLDERGVDVPVILVSAYADAATRARAVETGALALLNKPIDAIALGRQLERATAQSA